MVVAFLCIAGSAMPGFGLPLEDWESKSYCARRPGDQCCPGRNDQCTMPFGDTLCYCDIFCNRTLTDCCPDFLGYCMGIDVPLGFMAEKIPTTEVKSKRISFSVDHLISCVTVFLHYKELPRPPCI